jgi:serine/threonine protein phosphatase PrpC
MTKDNNFIFSSIKGVKHKENWDTFLIIDETKHSLFAVFDGVSNASDGGKGAMQAKQFIKDNYQFYLENTIDIRKLMFDLNLLLVRSNLREPYSTYCIVFYDKITQFCHYSWLGDSRLYLITNKFTEQLTYDDSYSENILTKYLGNPDLTLNDFRQLKCIKQDVHLLLCTDGFYKIFESNKLEFFSNFHKKSMMIIEEKITSLIRGKNLDDSTFIFVK